MSTASPSDWPQAFRYQMPVAERFAYFDHAAVAPLSGPAAASLNRWTESLLRSGDVHWPSWSRHVEGCRETAARLVNADPDEIALVKNTTEGVNLVAEGFPWQSGDNVVMPAGEFPTNRFAWQNLERLGVETRIVPVEQGRISLDALAAACDGRTRMLTVSWIGFADGWRNDLDQLCELAHSRGILLFVDAIQGLGVQPLDVRQTPIDFFAADGHKWLLGPEGAGLLYVKREHLQTLTPLGLGWNSVENAYDFSRSELQLKPSAARYEGGSYNVAGFVALESSLELFEQYTVAAISARILELSEMAVEQLESIGAQIVSCREPAHKSGIVVFQLGDEAPQELRRRCLAHDVVVSCRGAGIRIAPHAYNSAGDVDRLIRALRSK